VSALNVMKLSLTEDCNLRCRYCYQRQRRREPMTRATLDAALELAARLGDDQTILVLSGGEPLLAEDLVLSALDHHPPGRTRLLTNGTLLHESLLDRMSRARAQLQISADGIAAAQAGRGSGTWEALDRRLDMLRTQEPDLWAHRFTLAMTVTPQNVVHFSRSVAWALGHDVRRLEITLACGLTRHWGRAACRALAREMARVLTLSRDHRQGVNRIPATFLQPRSGADHAGDAPCAAADVHALAVATDGGVHGCGVLADVARWHPSPTIRRAAAALHLGRVDDPGLPARWLRRQMHTTPVMPPTSQRSSGRRNCGDCHRRDQCLVCPLAGPEPSHAPDAHCLFERLAHHGRRFITADDPLVTSLMEKGAELAVATALSAMVARAQNT